MCLYNRHALQACNARSRQREVGVGGHRQHTQMGAPGARFAVAASVPSEWPFEERWRAIRMAF